MVELADSTLFFGTSAQGVQADDLHILSMEAREGISRCYEVELVLACSTDGGISPDGIKALLTARSQVSFGPTASSRLSGVMREIELVEMNVDGRSSVYRAHLVPRFWLTSLTRRTRVFDEKSFPSIIEAVLGEMGLKNGTDFELRLDGSYPPREFILQYEETDFDFLARWMERTGIFYVFEQSDDGDKIVLTDRNANLLTAPEHAESQHSLAELLPSGGISHFQRKNRIVPAHVHLRDYNWRNPAVPVIGDADIDAEHGIGLQAFYGDHFKDDAEGAQTATVRAEGWLCTREVYSGRSANYDFSAGSRFKLANAPIGDLDQEYVVTEITHRAEQQAARAGHATYRNEFSAIPFATAYRPPRRTPWPRIDGVMTAKIDAASVSSAAPIDDKGRYKVLMPFDLYGRPGGKSSRWVRKAEPYSGGGYGMHMTLHVGTEVLLAFIGGDPDRPIIVGSVPNSATSSPMAASHATRSAIRTRSGILIDFEDDA